MGLEAEVEALRRKNRLLKMALVATIAVFFVGVLMAAGIAGIAATRARAQTLMALEQEHLARAHAEAAFAKAQEALERAKTQDEAQP